MNKKFTLPALIVLSALPLVALAQFPTMPSLTSGLNLYLLLVGTAAIILEATWIIAVAFVIIMFVMAGFKFITAQGDPTKLADARRNVIWAVGGIVVILLAFSILVIMRITLGV